MSELDPVAQLALRLGLAALWTSSAWHKLRDRVGFQAALSDYRLLPAGALAPAALVLPGVEAALAAALLLPATAAPAALGSAALLAVYTGAIAANLARGRRELACGCGGPADHRRLGPGLVVRNVALAGLALAGALPTAWRPLGWLDAATLAAAVAGSVLVYAALDQCLANGARLRPLRGLP